jgi:hypothetical protein
MKLRQALLAGIATGITLFSATQAQAGESFPRTAVTSIPQSGQINNSGINDRSQTDRINTIELRRLAIDRANVRIKMYTVKQRLMKTLGAELADALEKKQYFRARLIAMQLAPKFGFKDYKLFLAEVTSNQFPTAAIGSSGATLQPATPINTTVNPQTSQLWDAPVDRLQTQQIASSN